MKLPNSRWVLLTLIAFFFTWNAGCSSRAPEKNQENQQSVSLDVETIEEVTGMTGTESNGEYKLVVPQNDLNVTVDGFKIIPPMGMGSWLAFSPTQDGAKLMGDVLVKENEIAAIQQVLLDYELNVTALHNHFVREQPSVMYMHIGGSGSEKELASGAKEIFERIAEMREGNPADSEADTVQNSLDTQQIADILGHEGSMSRGVYKVTIGRPDVTLMHQDNPVSTFMGFNTWASWQGTPEKAAVAGDFVMLEDEVEPVINTLASNGIEVVALHNHMIHFTFYGTQKFPVRMKIMRQIFILCFDISTFKDFSRFRQPRRPGWY